MATDAAFDALADPVRRAILELLARSESCTAGEVAEAITTVGRTAVSTHLRVLRTAGLIDEQRDGRFRRYSLTPDGPMRDIIGLLQGLLEQTMDDDRLGRGGSVERPARSA